MRFIRTFLFILTFCALAVPALAQSPNNGGLLIVVVDQQGAVVAGARVVVTNTATGVTRDSVSGPDGSAAISALPLDGSYTVAGNGGKGASLSSITFDTLAPTLVSTTPEDGGNLGAASGTTLVASFSEDIVAGSGNLRLVDSTTKIGRAHV